MHRFVIKLTKKILHVNCVSDSANFFQRSSCRVLHETVSDLGPQIHSSADKISNCLNDFESFNFFRKLKSITVHVLIEE